MTIKETRFAVDDDIIEIWRYGRNDYCAYWVNGDYSIRGTLAEVMTEIFSIYEDVEEVTR